MRYSHDVGGNRYTFDLLKDLLAKASPARSGDYLAGSCRFGDDEERVAAQNGLGRHAAEYIPVGCGRAYESDEVTRLIIDDHDARAFAPVAHLTVGGFRDWLLSDARRTRPRSKTCAGAHAGKCIAAVSKICRVQDLILIAQKCRVVTKFRNTIGPEEASFDASSAQPSDRRSDRASRPALSMA